MITFPVAKVGMRVLVADDSELMRKILIGHLTGMGISEVDAVADGAEALVRAKAGNYELILLDWNMPKMLGIDVLRRLRGSGMQTPVVIVTTEANRPNVLEAVKAGASNYIMKPLTRDSFVTRIRQTLQKAGLSAP